ncbi:MAG: hypothetical protein KAS52_07695, partial [Candidatus Heimdallarchaeota archaeon]|nr:hypothetical protein [Candidatus Heimdallarchaeota archaeon]
MRNKTRLQLLTMLLVLTPIFTFSTAADNEEILYMTGFEEGGGIEESSPVIDMNGDLHVFMHIVTASTDRLVHLYYIDGEPTFEIIVEDAIGLEIRTTYSTDINLGVVYSIFTLLGDLVFYNYIWMPNNVLITEIYSITQHDLIYITYFDVEYANGYVHIFHNKYDDIIMTTVNMTHHYGFINIWKTESFIITPPEDYQDVVETIVDRNGDM